MIIDTKRWQKIAGIVTEQHVREPLLNLLLNNKNLVQDIDMAIKEMYSAFQSSRDDDMEERAHSLREAFKRINLELEKVFEKIQNESFELERENAARQNNLEESRWDREDSNDDDTECGECGGDGEGMNAGSKCSWCGGSGIVRRHMNWDEDED